MTKLTIVVLSLLVLGCYSVPMQRERREVDPVSEPSIGDDPYIEEKPLEHGIEEKSVQGPKIEEKVIEEATIEEKPVEEPKLDEYPIDNPEIEKESIKDSKIEEKLEQEQINEDKFREDRIYKKRQTEEEQSVAEEASADKVPTKQEEGSSAYETNKVDDNYKQVPKPKPPTMGSSATTDPELTSAGGNIGTMLDMFQFFGPFIQLLTNGNSPNLSNIMGPLQPFQSALQGMLGGLNPGGA